MADSNVRKYRDSDIAIEVKRLRRTIVDASDEFLCPITLELPVQPVVAEDGRIYERAAIEEWLRASPTLCGTEQVKSPVTNEPIGPRLVDATQVRNLIEFMVRSDAVAPERAAMWKRLLADKAEVTALRRRAEEKDLESMVALGEVYRSGSLGVRRDLSAASRWFMEAANSGSISVLGALRLTSDEISASPYMARQPIITGRMRSILVDWLIEVHFLLGFRAETLHLTVHLVDKFADKEVVLREKLQLLGVGALLVACKAQKEPSAPSAAYLAYLTANAYTEAQVVHMEAVLGRMFSGRLVVPTAPFFLAIALDAAKDATKAADTVTAQRAAFILETSLVDHSMLRFKAPMAAASALLLALHWGHLAAEASPESMPTTRPTPTSASVSDAGRKRLKAPLTAAVTATGCAPNAPEGLSIAGGLADCWPARCAEVTGFVSAELAGCAQAMLAQVMRPPRKTSQGRVLDAVLKKFSSDRFNRVALLPLPQGWPHAELDVMFPASWGLLDEDLEDDGARSDGVRSDEIEATSAARSIPGGISSPSTTLTVALDRAAIPVALRRAPRRGRAAAAEALGTMATTRASHSAPVIALVAGFMARHTRGSRGGRLTTAP